MDKSFCSMVLFPTLDCELIQACIGKIESDQPSVLFILSEVLVSILNVVASSLKSQKGNLSWFISPESSFTDSRRHAIAYSPENWLLIRKPNLLQLQIPESLRMAKCPFKRKMIKEWEEIGKNIHLKIFILFNNTFGELFVTYWSTYWLSSA